MHRLGFGSLRIRFVLPHLAAAFIAAVGVAVVSAYLGRNWAIRDVYNRIERIEQTLNSATIPLTPSVLNSAADLTGTELITIQQQAAFAHSTIELSESERATISQLFLEQAISESTTAERSGSLSMSLVVVSGRRFLGFPFQRGEAAFARDRIRYVIVLADAAEVDEASSRAAILPLATGFSCIILLSTLTVVFSSHLVRRLITLQRGVQKIAGGDFELSVADNSTDEVGQLGRAVDGMAAQLKQLWSQVNRQQSERLLHLIAGGMAHQLRNTLTGARMAMELHAQRLGPQKDDGTHDEIEVAIRELDIAEDYVRRLLLVSAGKSQEEKPDLVTHCLRDVQATHAAVAKHLRVDLSFEPFTDGCWVTDGAAFSAAISNLVLNALQAANTVRVSFEHSDAGDEPTINSANSATRVLTVRVSDNGPGIDPAIEAELFEPFVTSKPEGMGLGLALVRRSAEQLGGDVRWKREAGNTIFEFRCRVFHRAPNS